MEKPKFSFKGWRLPIYLKGRKKMIITIIGAISAWIITNDPLSAGIVGAITDLAYAVIEFYIKDNIS